VLGVWILLFAIGLVLLIKGGDWFVDGATGVAKRFHIPELLIGATVVSIGTTLPEVMVSAISAAQGSGAMAYGNAIGSIICNTSLIAAITVAIKPCGADRKTMLVPVLFFFGAAISYAIVAYVSGTFSRAFGIGLLTVFVVYMVMNTLQAVKDSKNNKQTDEVVEGKAIKDIALLIVGAVLIAGGAKLLVDNGTEIAKAVGIPQSVIALTFVALGTSLPELVTAITSLVKGHGALSLGNIIGANLFNIILVSGVSVTISPFGLNESLANGSIKSIGTLNSSLVVDVPLMLTVMVILTVPTLFKQRLSRWQGILLLMLYAGFCVFQFAV